LTVVPPLKFIPSLESHDVEENHGDEASQEGHEKNNESGYNGAMNRMSNRLSQQNQSD